jgi:hypothetical protein
MLKEVRDRACDYAHAGFARAFVFAHFGRSMLADCLLITTFSVHLRHSPCLCFFHLAVIRTTLRHLYIGDAFLRMTVMTCLFFPPAHDFGRSHAISALHVFDVRLCRGPFRQRIYQIPGRFASLFLLMVVTQSQLGHRRMW